MAINKKVNTKFTANGDLSKKFGLMTRLAAKFGNTADKSFRKANRSASSFRSTTKSIVAGLGISRGIGMIGQGLRSVASGFIAFDKAALGATVRFKDIGPEADNFDQKLKEIQKTARAAGQSTKFTAAQAAEGLNFMAKAGFTSAEAMLGLSTMINLAVATGEDFESVADKSSDLLGAFGLAADTTGQKIASLTRLNDVLSKSANTANVTIETMFETMKVAAPVGKLIGVELEELAALTAVLGSAGLKGDKGATALKNSFLNLSTQKKPVVDMLKAINVNIDDGSGNMRKFTDILEDVGAATGEFGNIKVSKVLDQIFGKRAIAGASNLIDRIKEIREFEKSMIDAGGTAQKTADVLDRSIENKLLSLGSAATEAGFKIFEAFAVDGKSGIDALTDAIRGLDMSGIIFIAKQFLGILISIKNVIAGITRPFAFIAAKAVELGVVDFLAKGAGQITSGFGLLGGNDGGGEERQAPNQQEAKASAFRQSTFSGNLDISGAPQGSTLTTGGDFPDFNVNMLGQN